MVLVPTFKTPCLMCEVVRETGTGLYCITGLYFSKYCQIQECAPLERWVYLNRDSAQHCQDSNFQLIYNKI